MRASVSESVGGPVSLRRGFVVPVEALRLAWALEDRGGRFHVDGGDLIVDIAAGELTQAERASIRRWKAHLIAIVSYEAPPAGATS